MRVNKRYWFVLVLLISLPGTSAWRRRRRTCSARDCVVTQWTSWTSCSEQCGYSGTQHRRRDKKSDEYCGGSCNYQFQQTRSCNRDRCRNGGTPLSSSCFCRTGWTGHCCEIKAAALPTQPVTRCSPRDCVVTQWTSWSPCSEQCGYSGSQHRHRDKQTAEYCSGSCNYQFQQTRSCNRDKCRNGGSPLSKWCSCRTGWTGHCCEIKASKSSGDDNTKKASTCNDVCIVLCATLVPVFVFAGVGLLLWKMKTRRQSNSC